MQTLRKKPPRSIASIPLITLRDYQDGSSLDSESGIRQKNINLPSSNVLQCVLADGSLVTVRPSGTEPKIKFYASCRSDNGSDIAAARHELKGKISGIEEWINDLIQHWGSKNA